MNRCQRTALLRRVAIGARRFRYDETKLRTDDASSLRKLGRQLGLTDAGHPKAPGVRPRKRSWKEMQRVQQRKAWLARLKAERA